MMEKKMMSINLEQQKLISHPLRSKIIYLLSEKELTSKQVAESLDKTPGSIHYHIQQLYKMGIIELTEVRENKGINEKYYRSKATHFRLEGEQPTQTEEETEVDKYQTYIDFSEENLKQFKEDYNELLMKYLKLSVNYSHESKDSYHLKLSFLKVEEEEL